MKFCKISKRDKLAYKILLRSIWASKTYIEIMACEQCVHDPWGAQIHLTAYNRLCKHIGLKKAVIRKRGLAQYETN